MARVNDDDEDQSSDPPPPNNQLPSRNPQSTNSNSNSNEPPELSLDGLLYSAASFHAIVTPVTLCMILSALAVTYINTPQSEASGQAATQTYEVFGQGGGSGGDGTSPSTSPSNGQQLGFGLANAFIIVGVICAMTFVIVVLYKYRCMKILLGYMMLSSSVLLGFLGYNMFATAVEKYNLIVNWLSTVAGIYNFSAVGVWSIFFPAGIPSFVTQGYLIASSVLLAWQLSNFDAWTAWALLVALALYDLFAVLSPCGPLKALVNLMSQDNAPNMPGLLYEANLPSGIARPNRRQQRNNSNNNNNGHANSNGQETASSPSPPEEFNVTATAPTPIQENSSNEEIHHDQTLPCHGNESQSSGGMKRRTNSSTTSQNQISELELPMISLPNGQTGPHIATILEDNRPTGKIPLAIAKLYRLQVVNAEPAPILMDPLLERGSERETENVNDTLASQHTPEQLRSDVDVYFPRNGGRIEPLNPSSSGREQQRYVVKGQNGDIRRILIVERSTGRIFEEQQQGEDDRPTGKVPLAIAKMYRLQLVNAEPPTSMLMDPLLEGESQRASENNNVNEGLASQYTPEQLRSEVDVYFPRNGGRIEPLDSSSSWFVSRREQRYVVKSRNGDVRRILYVERSTGRIFEEHQQEDEEERSNSIKLGLGDFIFYSVLVAKAAQYSFTTFCACTLVVLAGLGTTLVLLAVYGHALPALPISIFLGVIFYLVTRYLVEPFIQAMFQVPVYV